nr:RNA-directed DNA polymerase, eukaryota [Tanacetum cinerariifolium]
MIAVYAPQDSRDRIILWDYLQHVIGKWKGEVITMGDFNEVRYKSDRFGSSFNVIGANIFNSFITNSGLVEVNLGGCRGKEYWIRANETVGWVPDFTDESDDEEQDEFNYDNDGNDNGIPGEGEDIGLNKGMGNLSDVEEVQETIFEDEGLRNSKEDEEAQNSNTDKSDDPFNIYPLLNKGNISVGCENVSNSLEFPPGFTPAMEKVEVNTKKVDANSNEKEVSNDSQSSGHFKKSECPRTGGSILSLLEDVIKVGQVMGFNMDGCISNMGEIISSHVVEEVYR